MNGYLDHVPRQTRTSDNDKGDNEGKPRIVHRSPGIYLTAEENSGNPQLGDRLKTVRPVSTEMHASK